MNIGERIKILRKQQKLKQTDLAKMTNLSKQTIYKYENNLVANIPSYNIEKIAFALNITPSHLQGWDEKEKDLINNGEELISYLFELKNRPEMKMLFSISKKCTKEEVEQTVRIIEALRNNENK